MLTEVETVAEFDEDWLDVLDVLAVVENDLERDVVAVLESVDDGDVVPLLLFEVDAVVFALVE